MQVISQKNCDILETVVALAEGKTIVYPTETCYGLGCDATNGGAVRRIFQIKGRMENKPLLILVADAEMAARYVQTSELFERLAKKYWPGALTIVAPKKESGRLATGVVSPENTVAVRVSSQQFVRELLRSFGKPIVSTSANIAGGENPYDPEDVIAMFSGRIVEPDVLIDGGVLPQCKPTTIADISAGKLNIIRQGELSVDVK